jgi:ATP-dependent Clp protease protease subunit
MALPSSRILIHQPWGGVFGQAVDISIQARELIRIKKLIVSYFARHTGKSPETVEKDFERDYYMSAEEAVEYGLIDKILKPSSPEKPRAGTEGVHKPLGLLDG